ncbi:MAG: hypothetical protein K8I29_02115 [Alphaproteobacteria bacterium]|uniref:Lipoprotein n=1 Tax=Candidatus Nitrobium versatile TaxID=2884831 RepID=A0A953J897_9BACT|nr:hypothetical protein [Candidatus Nitrobium versatile]
MKRIFFLLAMAAFLVSCATVSDYPLTLSYAPKAAGGDEMRKGTIAVPQFVDKRKVADTRYIGIKNDEARFIALLDDPAAAVSKAVAAYLESRGYAAGRVNERWDGSVQTLKPEWGDRVVGGAVEEFSLTVRSSSLVKMEYVTTVRLFVVYADAAAKRILHQERVEASSSYVTVSFNKEKAEELINKALADAVERALAGADDYLLKK